MSGRHHQDKPLKAVIQEMLRRTGMDKKYMELDIIQHYKDLMGPVIANKTTAIYVKEHTLYLKLDSGVLKEELSYGKSKIIRMINEKMGSVVIEQIEIR